MDANRYRKQIRIGTSEYAYYSLQQLQQDGIGNLERLPFSIRILVENLLRHLGNGAVDEPMLRDIANWKPRYETPREIAHHPGRVLMQDFTGVPGIVDLASLRDALADMGKTPSAINPLVPVDMVVDHSVQIDHYGTADALRQNVEMEYQRNGERYSLLKWAQKSFDNLRIVPPNSGICHQVNLEYLAKVVWDAEQDGQTILYPDSLVGTDSHTTMINGIGVMGWGVGGIEAEAVMLGQPYYMSIPEVVGVRLLGQLREGVTATDLVLTLTELLRKHKVVEKFVEYYGPGMKNLALFDRATIANMAPEYGATMGFFPVDDKSLDYLRLTNRNQEADITEAYCREQKLYYTGTEEPDYSQKLELDLSSVEPSLAGPSRPQDRVSLSGMEARYREIFGEPQNSATVEVDGETCELRDGSVVIAAITSCTNTSNPVVMIGAGLIAKRAAERGMRVPAHVKTSVAPGSRVVQDYLEKAGLLSSFEALRFHLAGFGCTTCIGNSGPLLPQIDEAITSNSLNVASVLSGNRNFEARIHPNVRANYLASPMLVVLYALAGHADFDIYSQPIGRDAQGKDVHLKDLWPDTQEILDIMNQCVAPEGFAKEYAHILDGDDFWQNLDAPTGQTYDWDPQSTYIRRPPFFEGFQLDADAITDIQNARVLLWLGDSVTTDHISPAGVIPKNSPAGQYLMDNGTRPADFNSYGSRRGNHEVMMRGTFANVRIKNKIVAPKEGGYTRTFPDGDERFVYDAAVHYAQQGTPLVVFGGKEYGTGSSRDWAAKGTLLLGVKAVIAESFERIHRSNLIGMGVLPIVYKDGETADTHGITGQEQVSITGAADLAPNKPLQIRLQRPDGSTYEFEAIAKLNTDIEVQYMRSGGILAQVLRRIAAEDKS